MFRSSLWIFYLLSTLDSANYFSWAPSGLVQAVWGRRSNPRSERKPIVHRLPEVLLAAEVALRSLYGRVAQQELNLLKFATTRVT